VMKNHNYLLGYRLPLYFTMLVAIIFTGCAPVYIPNSANAPLFEEKGTLLVSAFGGSNGYDAQLAYGITDHFAVMANGSYQSKEFDSNAIDKYHKHMFAEFGGGYYTKMNDNGRFECFGGYGFGQSETAYDYTFFYHNHDILKGTYQRFFVQTDLGLSSDFDVVTSGISLRGSYVNFFKFASETKVYNESMAQYYFEPAVFFRVGWKYVKLQFQFGGCVLMQHDKEFDHQPFMMSGGLVFNIPFNTEK
jgi:hypothetical protein